jgi:glutathione S-transferase
VKLFYAPGTCSLAPHIALREYGIPFTLAKFDMRTRLLDDGSDLLAVNGKGLVPVLELDNGERLAEVSAIQQFIADQKPDLFPLSADPMRKYRVMEWLNFIATEIHKIYWPIFHGGSEDEKTKAREKVAQSLTWANEALGQQHYLLGNTFSVVDCYFFTTLNFARPAGVDLGRWPAFSDYMRRIRERPAVVEALRAEGLLR